MIYVLQDKNINQEIRKGSVFELEYFNNKAISRGENIE